MATRLYDKKLDQSGNMVDMKADQFCVLCDSLQQFFQ